MHNHGHILIYVTWTSWIAVSIQENRAHRVLARYVNLGIIIRVTEVNKKSAETRVNVNGPRLYAQHRNKMRRPGS